MRLQIVLEAPMKRLELTKLESADEDVLKHLLTKRILMYQGRKLEDLLVNVVCHMPRFGHRTYDTADDSRNIPCLSCLTWGLSLHNNHHRYPNAACFAQGRQLDPAAWVIKWIASKQV